MPRPERTIQSHLLERLERRPQQRSIAYLDSGANHSWLTFEELYGRAAAYGRALASLGLKRGQVVVLVIAEPLLCSQVLFAALCLGAIPLLVAPPTIRGTNSKLEDILRYVVRKTMPALVLLPEIMTSEREQLSKTGRRTRFITEKELQLAGGEAPQHVLPSETDVAAYQLTSGTTGFPRICVWKQRSVVRSLDGMEKAMKLGERDVCLNWTPLYHDMGLVNNFLLGMVKGIPLVLLSPLDFVRKPSLWIQGLSRCGATISWSPNFGFALTAQRAEDSEIEEVRLDHVRGLWNAAERVHEETMRAFYVRFASKGLRREALKTNFGCAENVGGATFSDPDGVFVVEKVDAPTLRKKGVAMPRLEASPGDSAITIVSAGRPHTALRLKILNRRGQALPDGHVGELALETPSRMSGYLGRKRETRRALHGKYLRTGDLGYLRGEEFFWVGRLTEKINLHGKKFDPSDFEEIMFGIPGLREGCFVAFGVDNAAQGTQDLIIASEIREPARRSLEGICMDIRDRIMRRLGIPVQDVLLMAPGALTKTSSGKRRHRHFKVDYLAGVLDPIHVSKGKRTAPSGRSGKTPVSLIP